MVSSSLKTLGATAVMILGVVMFLAAVSTPTTDCTIRQVDGETVERECETDESLARLVDIGLVAGAVFSAGGVFGVYRYGKGARQVLNVVIGGLLTLLGGAVAYIFLKWYLNLANHPEFSQDITTTDMVFFFGLTAAGGVIMILGLWQIWRAVSSR